MKEFKMTINVDWLNGGDRGIIGSIVIPCQGSMEEYELSYVPPIKTIGIWCKGMTETIKIPEHEMVKVGDVQIMQHLRTAEEVQSSASWLRTLEITILQ